MVGNAHDCRHTALLRLPVQPSRPLPRGGVHRAHSAPPHPPAAHCFFVDGGQPDDPVASVRIGVVNSLKDRLGIDYQQRRVVASWAWGRRGACGAAPASGWAGQRWLWPTRVRRPGPPACPQKAVLHPLYQPGNDYVSTWDVAVLILDRPVNLTKNPTALLAPARMALPAGLQLWAAGWGRTELADESVLLRCVAGWGLGRRGRVLRVAWRLQQREAPRPPFSWPAAPAHNAVFAPGASPAVQ